MSQMMNTSNNNNNLVSLVIRLDSICDTPLWDSSQSWNTTTPTLSPCLLDTFLVWLPALFLLSFFPYTLYDYLHSGRPSIIWNRFNVFKQFVAFVLTLIGTVHAIHLITALNDVNDNVNEDVKPDIHISTARLVAVVVQLCTYLLLSIFLYLQRLYGFVNGGVIWFYLFFQLICSSITLAASQHIRPIDQWIFNCVELVLQVILFLVCSFSDRIDNRVELLSSVSLYGPDAKRTNNRSFVLDNGDGDDDHSLIRDSFESGRTTNTTTNKKNKKICPKETASFPSKLSFSWFDSLAFLGFRRPLTVDDLWQIRIPDRSANLFLRFNHYWKHKSFNGIQSGIHTKQHLFGSSRKSFSLDDYCLIECKNEKKENGTTPLAPPTKTEINCDDDFDEDDGGATTTVPNKKNVAIILAKTFWLYFLFPNIARFLTDLLQLANPTILKFMIVFTMNRDEPFWHGVFYSLIFVITNVVHSISTANQQHRMSTLSMRVRACLVGAIYRKSLVLAMHARKNFTSGEIVNLMAVDAQRINDLVPWICFLWTAPVQIAIALYLLWLELGAAVFGGLGLMVIFIPLNGMIAGHVKRIQQNQMKLKDTRLKAFIEILNGMKVLKLYAWEEAFTRNIEQIRNKEIRYIRNSGLISTVFVCISACSPFMVSCLTFAIYILSDSSNVLTPQKAFVSIALFNLIRIPLTMIPNLITSLILTMISMNRVNRFLNSPEISNYVNRRVENQDAITISNATFSWDDLQDDDPNESRHFPIQNTLSNINLNVPKGSLVAVVGNVGSGKSSLLYALLGDMQKKSGKVNISGDLQLAYVAQQAWIQNSTVQENILFGSTHNHAKYNKVIEACALKSDFEMLPGGDQTEIGEKGINLSGGQKQRVSIARACYADADLYLFDDPLSAVDSHVGKHIFDEVLSNQTGILKDKTRILVTNALYMLTDVDLIVLLKNGTIEAIGNYNELMQKSNVFSELINNFSTSSESDISESDIKVVDMDAMDEVDIVEITESSISNNIQESDDLIDSEIIRSLSLSSRDNKHLSTKKSQLNVSLKNSKLVEAEQIETGQITFSVYKKFFSAMSPKWSALIIVNYFLVCAANTGSSFWLSFWTDDDPALDRSHFYLSVYFAIVIVQVSFVGFGWMSIVMGTLNSSKMLHKRLLNSILHAPMHFFDTTPLGRIINRFSKDIDILDNGMQLILRVLARTSFQVLATLFVISFLTPIFLGFAILFILLFLFIQRFYISTSRQLKRLESVTRSPIYTHFSETINGVSTIKAFGACERFIEESDKRIDENQQCFYPNAVSNCWIQVRLDFLANCLIFFAALFVALSKSSSEDSAGGLTGSQTGLSLSYALNVTLSLIWCVRMFSELENNVVAVERISEYTNVQPEADWHKPNDTKLPENWPEEGVIKFENYGTRYRPGLDLVVKGIDLSIKKGEKIGIVGRTGAGKSSLTLALFRIIEASMGKITMDNVDISTLGLQELRSRITIIPQDPVLFCGTIRLNLDPFSMYSDDQLWAVLELSHLKKFISSLEFGLEHAVSESGENLSVGQRQLICLARALLRRTNVLVLDEATAAVDLETDSLIQSTIRKEFSHCTVLTIAHRLNTILDSDRVLVMDAGRVAEFDSPKSLLGNQSSIFYSLAKDAGIV